MTSPAELNAARLTQQLEINRQKIAVKALQAKARNGSKWEDIRDDWNTSDESIKTTRRTLTNLNGQNEGLKNQTGYVSTKVKLTTNIVETNVLTTDLVEVRKVTQSTENTAQVLNNLPRDSAGAIVQNEAIGVVNNSRFTSPIDGNNQFFDDTTQSVKPVVASLNKPTNARLSSLSGLEDQELGDNKGSGTTSTTGGSVSVVKLNQTQGSGATAGSQTRATDDDSTNIVGNSVGNASQVVDGRAAIAAEFAEKIVPTENPLLGLASQTYSLAIYLMNSDEYKQLLGSDKKILPSTELILQSGGAPVGQRNKFFDVDFFIDNLNLDSVISSQGTSSPHNAVKFDFNILEPSGITFLERLRQAVWEHTGDKGQTINGQNYLLVIRFFGYDDQGNLVSNDSKVEETSDPNALVEKFIPFQISSLNYKITSEMVTYNVKAVVPQENVGYSTARGTIPFNFQLNAPDVQTLLNGSTVITPTTASQFAGGPPNQNKKIEAGPATVSQGLTNALNKHQDDLVAKKGYSIPDRYIIELEDVAGLKDAKMRKQGEVDKRFTDMQTSSNPNEKFNQKKQNFKPDSRNFSIAAGTQIVQLIDQVMKNSTYITAQQTVAFDEVTKKQIQNPPVKTVQWYKVTQTCTPLEYDIDRGDYAYEIKYLISRYQINTPRSPYFPPAMYRGVHKLYNYWFTGENTEVINFEIDVNSNYLQPIGIDGIGGQVNSNARFAEKKFFQSSAEESTQGGAGESTVPAAQLASRLYSTADVAKCSIEIVGDPDFLTQSELFYNTEINLSPFEADGSVNSRSSEVLIEIRFNRPVDYNLATGLTPVFADNLEKSGITGELNLPEESLVFNIVKCRSTFKGGKFTQTLEGTARDFDTAVDSPSQKKAETNKVEKVSTPVARPSGVRSTKKEPVPSYDDAIQRRARGLGVANNSSTPAGVNQRPDYITGGTRPSGPTPVTNQGSPVVPNQNYDDAIMRNQRISTLTNSSTNYVDPIINKGNWQPQVNPKPGATVQSDDAGANTGFQGSLLKRKTQRALERSKARINNGATVTGNRGGGTNSSAFR